MYDIRIVDSIHSPVYFTNADYGSKLEGSGQEMGRNWIVASQGYSKDEDGQLLILL